MPIITEEYMAFKAILRDKYGNFYHRSTYQEETFDYFSKIYPSNHADTLASIPDFEQLSIKNMFNSAFT